jgi:hypothetical protein
MEARLKWIQKELCLWVSSGFIWLRMGVGLFEYSSACGILLPSYKTDKDLLHFPSDYRFLMNELFG